MLRRRTRLLISLLAIVAVVSALCQAIAFVEAPRASQAAASPATGTAGMFVPLQGRLADSRTSTNLSKLKAGVFQSLQIEGATMNAGNGNTAQIPPTGSRR